MILKAQRPLRHMAVLALLSTPLFAQGPTDTPTAPAVTAAPVAALKFDIADVHLSPHSNNPFMRGGDLHGDRVTIRQASMVDLIADAYGIEHNNVLRGPAWLDIDRFDITAKAPRTTSSDDVKLMLRTLLADRFSLVEHTDTKPLPAYALTLPKGSAKMKESDGSADSNCQFKPPPDQGNGQLLFIEFDCHNRTMSQLAHDLKDWGGDYLSDRPVVDQTNLKGAWDFTFRFTPKGQLTRAAGDAITLTDAVSKELGLKLDATTAPLPVVYVDRVSETPTPNPPGLDKALPPPLPAEFDVAILKPSAPDTRGINGQIKGAQINLTGATVQWMITWAWDISDDMVADAPKWLNQDHWDLLAKVTVDPATVGPKGPPQIDFDDLQQMLRNLLAERFNLKTHMEDRPADAYTLVAANPKLKKADPDNRTGCHEGPGADGKDPRIGSPILGRLLTCQNMTMAQFGDQLRIQANGYIHSPVLDSTGLKDAYDFTLSFSTAGQLRSTPPPPKDDSNPNAPSASDPNGGLSLFDAMQKQIGIKLEKQKRPVQMLVIDHVDQKPTED